ncbi:MAG: hypothetical protein ACYSSI_06500 [Planctomycetota bacterium]|jgi:hypothetical protein
MNKYFLIVGFMVVAGCSNETVVKSEPVKWVSVGTLVSVGPDTESTSHPGRLRSAVLGETKLSRTRVKTTKGVYIISDKIGIVETGIPVSVGYDSSDEYPDTPSYLAFGGKRYEIVR